MKEVKIYSTPTCPYCKMAKEYFSSRNIPYQDFDVSQDRDKLEEMVRLSGQMGVPVIVIDGQVVMGFDKTKIDGLLSQ